MTFFSSTEPLCASCDDPVDPSERETLPSPRPSPLFPLSPAIEELLLEDGPPTVRTGKKRPGR